MSKSPLTHKVRTCLCFDNDGEEAANFYVSLLPDSYIEQSFNPSGDGPALVVDFILAGSPYQVLNAGPMYRHSPAASISVLTVDQAETDRLWQALTENGGSEVRCSWLTDRYGVSWQIVPEAAPRLFSSPDRAGADRAFQAMLKMVKLDIATLEAAFLKQP